MNKNIEELEDEEGSEMLRVRFPKGELKEMSEFAKAVYDINRSQFIRLAAIYIMRNKPVLGKQYAPEGQSLHN